MLKVEFVIFGVTKIQGFGNQESFLGWKSPEYGRID